MPCYVFFFSLDAFHGWRGSSTLLFLADENSGPVQPTVARTKREPSATGPDGRVEFRAGGLGRAQSCRDL